MATDRLSTVLAAMGDVEPGGSVSVVDRVCLAAVTLLSLSGAVVSLMVKGQFQGNTGTSDREIAVVQELQFALGEGPGLDAWTSRAPVLVSDLAEPTAVRWPAFARAGVDAGVRAVFAFPLHLGMIRLGVLVLYRDRDGLLTADELAFGLVLADVATYVILGLQDDAPVDVLHEVLANEPLYWAEIHQATGMVSVQLDISLDEAFVRLRAHAFAEEKTLRSVSHEVVIRNLRLEGGS